MHLFPPLLFFHSLWAELSVSVADSQTSFYSHRIAAFTIPFAISFLITILMIRWGPALGLVDIPNSRKVHTRPIPKGGGPAIFVGWLFGTQFVGIDFENLCIWGGIGLLIVVLGLVDDLRPLPWQLRLAVQFIAAIGAVFMLSGLQVNNPSSLDPFLFWPLAVFWIVGLTNAFNMLDNMDALSAGVAWLAAAVLAHAGV
jgi:UDP-GlcNAc:undecaprenyl-phosphate GlcNAc-1-phosphate transferase